MRGAQRRLIQSSERLKLIPDRGTILYEIDTEKGFIEPGETLHIFNISDQENQRPASIVFYAPQDEA